MRSAGEREERYRWKIRQDEVVLKLQALSKESSGTGPEKVAQSKDIFRHVRS
jgi:hypothetical protein